MSCDQFRDECLWTCDSDDLTTGKYSMKNNREWQLQYEKYLPL